MTFDIQSKQDCSTWHCFQDGGIAGYLDRLSHCLHSVFRDDRSLVISTSYIDSSETDVAMANYAHYRLQRTEAQQARSEHPGYILDRVTALLQDLPG
jgi:hypothetical protein